MHVAYCTYFDHNYLPRGLALHASLQRHVPGAVLWVLCMSPECHAALTRLDLPNLRPIALEDFERNDDALLAAKANRSRIEYYFTCSPSLPLYVLREDPKVTHVTYVDADMFFFAPPDSIYAEMGDASIAIVEHRFPPRLREHEKWGRFNVGWLTFRRDERAMACLAWWRERCLEWCYDELQDDRFADQKYLERWPGLFPGLIVLQHPGVNLAPYNLENVKITNGPHGVLANGAPLVIFHFHGFQRVNAVLFDPNLIPYAMRADRLTRRAVFAPYLAAWLDALETTRQLLPTAMIEQTIRLRMKRRAWRQGLNLHGRIVTECVHAWQVLTQIARGQLLLRLGNWLW